MNELNDKRIFKRALPFLAVFVFTLSYAGFHFINDIAGGAKASDDYRIEIRPVNTPLNTKSEWEWNVTAFNSRPSESSQLQYKFNWCSHTDGGYGTVSDISCRNKENIDFFQEISNGKLNTSAAESIHTLKTQSVNCGRIELEVYENNELVEAFIQDTGKKCTTTEFSTGFNRDIASSRNPIDVINKTRCILFRCPDNLDEASLTPSPDGSQPGNQQPQTPLPNASDRPGVQHVINLARHIQAFCGGRVDGLNSACMLRLNINSANDFLAGAKIITSAITHHPYGGLQCVGFVKGAIAAQKNINFNYFGNAASYAKDRPPYNWHPKATTSPQINDLAVWTITGADCNGSDCGHIAYVTRVEGDKFFVTEANHGCRGGCVHIEKRMLTVSDYGLAGFLRL